MHFNPLPSRLRFGHNNLPELERCLTQSSGTFQLVVVDGIYSMDGDIADLPGIRALCDDWGATLMVDEAHSLGVLGSTGAGIAEYFGLPLTAVDIKMGTLSKAIPAAGGYLAGDRSLTDALRHNARPYIFSGALPPPLVGASIASFGLIKREPSRVERLRDNARHFRGQLRGLGFDVGATDSPVVPLICNSEQQAFDMTRRCRESGLYVTPVIFPAVAKSAPRLRLSVTAAHNREQLSHAASILHTARDPTNPQ